MLAKKCAQFGQVSFIQNVLAPSYNVLRDLAGMELKALSPLKHFVENDILRDRKSNETDRVSLEVQLLLDITHSCFLRDFHKAQQLAELFADAYKEERHVFNHIICNFYVGLAACHFGRQTKDKSWLLKAKHFLNRVELSLAHSVWNFENKYLLLKAECHYTAGEIIEAAKCYDESNISARDHKFVHELALGCELAGYFYKDQDDHTKSQILFNEAQSAYVRWGAMRKARCGEHP